MSDTEILTFDEYLSQGGSREEKLVVVFKCRPQLLSEETLGLIKMFFTNTLMRDKLAGFLPNIEYAVQRWENGDLIRDLKDKNVDFLPEGVYVP